MRWKMGIGLLGIVVASAAGFYVYHQSNQQHSPSHYAQWAAQHSANLSTYQAFLSDNRVNHIIEMQQLLRSSRDLSTCPEQEYEIPPQNQWPAIIPTLKLIEQLQQRQLLPANAQVGSSYRSQLSNTCSKGASRSKHLSNAAVDFDLPEQANLVKNLCTFWKEHGQAYNFGLGFYDAQHIHIDTLGFRTWGYSYTHDSSLCVGL